MRLVICQTKDRKEIANYKIWIQIHYLTCRYMIRLYNTYLNGSLCMHFERGHALSRYIEGKTFRLLVSHKVGYIYIPFPGTWRSKLWIRTKLCSTPTRVWLKVHVKLNYSTQMKTKCLHTHYTRHCIHLLLLFLYFLLTAIKLSVTSSDYQNKV